MEVAGGAWGEAEFDHLRGLAENLGGGKEGRFFEK
jgi:hypothetical protein